MQGLVVKHSIVYLQQTQRGKLLSHVTTGNISGILCCSLLTKCVCRHTVLVQLIKHVLRPAEFAKMTIYRRFVVR